MVTPFMAQFLSSLSQAAAYFLKFNQPNRFVQFIAGAIW
jgi:hypothetical protein